MNPSRRGLVVAAILLSMFMAAMEATVVATAMPTVVADLRGIELYGWVGSLYMLASTVTIPLWGKLADLWGRKPVMLAGLVLFLVGSVASGMSATMVQLVVFRAIQGAGAGSLQPVSLTLVGDLFAVEERGRIQGMFGALWGVAGMVGPLLGGLIVRALSWRWVFYINVPFGLLSGALLVAFLDEQGRAPRDRKPLDLAGAALLSGAVLALLMGVGGRWPGVMIPLAVAGTVGFVAVERRSPDPILPLSLFADGAIAVASVASTLMGAVMMSALMFLPLYVQAVWGGSPTEAGMAVAPMLVGWPIFSVLSGKLLPTRGPRVLVRWGLGGVAVGTAAVYGALVGGWGVWAVRGAMFVFGAGMGLANTAMIIAVQERVAWAQRGVATASTMFFRSIGGAVSVGALGALLAHRLAGVVDESRLNTMLGPTHGRDLGSGEVLAMARALELGMLPMFAVVAVLGALTALVGWRFPAVTIERRAEAGG